MTRASRFDILPAIDLRGGRVVRLRQGDFEQETTYDTDPVAVARAFAADGAAWLHVVDLDAARTGTPSNQAAIAAIIEAMGERAGHPVNVELAGGLRTEVAVAAALDSGAARAVVGTAAIRAPDFAALLIRIHGAERIAVAIDVRDGQAVGHGWARNAGVVDAVKVINRLAAVGVTTFEVTAIDRDGLLGGPDLELYRRLVAMGRGAIIASGGITSVEDIRAVREIGCSGAIIGRAVYEGRLTLEEALASTA